MRALAVVSRVCLSVGLAVGLTGCGGDDAGASSDGTGTEEGTGPDTGDGDGDPGPTPPSSCTMLPVPIARAGFEMGTGLSMATPGTVSVIGEVPGTSGPWNATWAGAKNQVVESGELSEAGTWPAEFEYSQATGWPGTCPADAPICAKSDELSFSLTDKQWIPTTSETLFAQASLCVDLNRTTPVCPLPVVIDEVSASVDADTPARLSFAVALAHPDLDCAGLDPGDGVTVTWTIADGGEGVVVEGTLTEASQAAVEFVQVNPAGVPFKGEVEVVCRKTYMGEDGPALLDLRASSEFYVDCE